MLMGSLTVLSFWRQRLGARAHPALGAG
jgi:hypothetical protein